MAEVYHFALQNFFVRVIVKLVSQLSEDGTLQSSTQVGDFLFLGEN